MKKIILFFLILFSSQVLSQIEPEPMPDVPVLSLLPSGLTSGSVPFIGTTGLLDESNSRLFYNQTNGWLGIGTNSLTSRFTIGYGNVDFTPIPDPVVPAIAESGVGILNDTYVYYVSYVNSAGLESRYSASVPLAVALKSIQVTIPVCPDPLADIVARRIYRMDISNLTANRVTTISNNTATTYIDNAAYAAISMNPGPPSVDYSSCVFSRNGERFLVSDRSTLFTGLNAGFSQLNNPTTLFLTNLPGNVGIGPDSLYSVYQGYSNTAVGFQSAYLTTDGYNNTAIGNSSLWTNLTGFDNTAVGYGSQYYTDTNYNTSLGYLALRGDSGGAFGDSNCTIGAETMSMYTTGSMNTVLGFRSAYSLLDGNNNVLVGYLAGTSLTSGSDNIFIGSGAGVSEDTGNDNIIIGFNADVLAPGTSNFINIGGLILGDNTLSTVKFEGIGLTQETMTFNYTGFQRSGWSSFSWDTNNVNSLGAVMEGNVSVCTLPAGIVVKNMYVVINSRAGGPDTLTIAVGRTGASYIDYIKNSDAKVPANTVYGDTAGERGTNLTGYDLSSFTATTMIVAHFVCTDAGADTLADVSTCEGTVFIETALLP